MTAPLHRFATPAKSVCHRPRPVLQSVVGDQLLVGKLFPDHSANKAVHLVDGVFIADIVTALHTPESTGKAASATSCGGRPGSQA